ncbi:hypothetical protein CC1G_09097 [Coprinopsis cinerea okayama7|uniref:Diaminopimelate epimerase-like protein n=1 Tax=Coprinopsis cinerea (strain Okayama-7 / 130 / ATCC MYA-4618 / FGSC 9003) TaxID=240176 RepID=A8P343_COPC7|nr:hypothetical protein CC1G_09097 [Coprinopsis cinerea okayama7\|eukprot:XP_001838469.1 hypothetical protein CC1G_09097 [Coprinopsis cinerea okayama7\
MTANGTTSTSRPSSGSGSAPFALLTAFSGTPFSGNPAAVVFLDPANTPRKALEGLAGNFNAPMIAFVGAVDDGSIVNLGGEGGVGEDTKKEDVGGEEGGRKTEGRRVVIKTSIRYLTYSGVEIPLCGHASVAAAGAILRLPFVQDLVKNDGGGVKVERVEFETWAEGRKVPVRVYEEDNKTLYELGLPSVPPVPLPKDEEDRIRAFVARAFGERIRDMDRDVVSVRRGVGGMEHAILVELDPSVGLGDADVDVNVFTDCGYTQNVITSLPSPSRSSCSGANNNNDNDDVQANNSVQLEEGKQQFDYVYRMFSPHVPGGEDAVCGSAQCLLAPYWYAKLAQLGCQKVVPGNQVTSYSASPRGGVVKVVWESDRDIPRDGGGGGEEKERVLLRGEVALLASGECFF